MPSGLGSWEQTCPPRDPCPSLDHHLQGRFLQHVLGPAVFSSQPRVRWAPAGDPGAHPGSPSDCPPPACGSSFPPFVQSVGAPGGVFVGCCDRGACPVLSATPPFWDAHRLSGILHPIQLRSAHRFRKHLGLHPLARVDFAVMESHPKSVQQLLHVVRDLFQLCTCMWLKFSYFSCLR